MANKKMDGEKELLELLQRLTFRIITSDILSFRLNVPPPQYIGKQIPLHFNVKCLTGISADIQTILVSVQVTIIPEDVKDEEGVELVFIKL